MTIIVQLLRIKICITFLFTLLKNHVFWKSYPGMFCNHSRGEGSSVRVSGLYILEDNGDVKSDPAEVVKQRLIRTFNLKHCLWFRCDYLQLQDCESHTVRLILTTV